jgi:DnaJ family protein C protein 7
MQFFLCLCAVLIFLFVPSCYLALGDVEGAVQYFKKCLQFGIDACVDRKISVEASDGLQKAQVIFLFFSFVQIRPYH